MWLGGGITLTEGVHDWGKRAVTRDLFKLYLGISLTTEKKSRKTLVGVAG
jgi:hypothetical protein